MIDFRFAFPIVKEWNRVVAELRRAERSQWRAYINDQIRRGYRAWHSLSTGPKAHVYLRETPDPQTVQQWRREAARLERLMTEPIPHVGKSMLELTKEVGDDHSSNHCTCSENPCVCRKTEV